MPGGLVLDPPRLAGFSGIRPIPDVHGAFDAFEDALARAARERRFVVQLGDLVDRGPYGPFCVERMLDLEERGLGLMIVGNHEAALAEAAERGGGSATRQETLMQFEEYGGDLLERFVARIRAAPSWIRAGDALLAHAAFHPAMLTGRAPDGLDLDAVAIHGYGTAAERRSGRFARSWVDAIPRGITVVVGHAVTPSRSVEEASGRLGGKAVFADTGFWIDGSAAPVLDLPLP